MIIKPIPIIVCSGDTDSTENSIQENILRSMKTGQNWFVLKGMVLLTNDCAKSQNIFLKRL